MIRSIHLFAGLLLAVFTLAVGCSSQAGGSSQKGAEQRDATDSDTSSPSDAASDSCSNCEGSDVSEDVSPDVADDAGARPAEGEMADSVTQYGVTWSFDKEYETGQFVTDDWWVVGPVTVTSVSPGPDEGRNGSMLNPVGPQAYDSRAGRHDAQAGVSFPLDIAPKNSLVSSISHPQEPECTQGGSSGWKTYTGSCQRGPIKTQAVLTVLSEPPPASAFRPPYSGDDKPLYVASDIDWQMLPDLAAPASMPSADDVLRHVQRPWIDHLNSWQMQHGCATLNMFCYGREVGDIVAILAAFVLVESDMQHEVARRLIQLGIDNYGVVRAGGGWGADGGHFNGRKFPIVFAGGLLGDQAMASPGTDIGNEDKMTYYGNNGKALWGRDCNSCYLSAGCAYNDGCDSGAKDCRDPEGLVDGCSSYRNCCTSRTWVGTALATRLLGLQDAWGHDAFFDYVDRWMSGDVDGGGGTGGEFVAEMWELHAP